MTPERTNQREMFGRRELREMRQEQRAIRAKALRSALTVALPCALFGWGSSYLLGLIQGDADRGFMSAAAAAGLLLGATSGALGGALAGLLYHSLFEQDQDIPVIVIGVMTLFTIMGGVYGTSQGTFAAAAWGVAIGTAVGLCAGVAVLMVYSALRGICVWICQEVRGY
jgi:hypothetical protein